MVSLEDFRRTFDRRVAQYGSAMLSLAIVRAEETKSFLRGTLEFIRNRKGPEEVLDYGPLILLRKSLSVGNALQFVETLSKGIAPPGEDFQVSRPPDLGPDKSPFDWDRMMGVSPDLPIPVSLGRVSAWPSQAYLLRARVATDIFRIG